MLLFFWLYPTMCSVKFNVDHYSSKHCQKVQGNQDKNRRLFHGSGQDRQNRPDPCGLKPTRLVPSRPVRFRTFHGPTRPESTREILKSPWPASRDFDFLLPVKSPEKKRRVCHPTMQYVARWRASALIAHENFSKEKRKRTKGKQRRNLSCAQGLINSLLYLLQLNIRLIHFSEDSNFSSRIAGGASPWRVKTCGRGVEIGTKSTMPQL